MATYFFVKLQQIPSVKAKVDKEVGTVLAKLENDLIDRGPEITYYTSIPKKGWSFEDVTKELKKYEHIYFTIRND